MTSESPSALHRDVFSVLPEYCSGQLTPPQRERVDAHINDCAECEQEITLLRQIFEPLTASVESTDFDTEKALARVKGRIEQLPDRPKWDIEGLLTSFADRLDLRLMAGAVALTGLLAVGITSQVEMAGDYDVLSATSTAGSTSFALELTTASDASLAALRAHFAETETDVTLTATGDGVYRLHFSNEPDVAALHAVLNHAKSANGVLSTRLITSDTSDSGASQ